MKCKGCGCEMEPKRWKPQYCSLLCAKQHTGYDHTNHPWKRGLPESRNRRKKDEAHGQEDSR